MEPDIDLLAVKARSEQIILRAGGRVNPALPLIGRRKPRSQEELIGRALVMNALINIAFQAPIPVIRDWIAAHELSAHLSASERALLGKSNDDLTEQDNIDLYWSVEALWALMWAGGLIEDLPVVQPVPNTMAWLVPNLQQNEGTSKFSDRMRMRPYRELHEMLDLYYRAHWYARDGSLRRYPTGSFSQDIIMERRKALEWLMDVDVDWDNVPQDT